MDTQVQTEPWLSLKLFIRQLENCIFGYVVKKNRSYKKAVINGITKMASSVSEHKWWGVCSTFIYEYTTYMSIVASVVRVLDFGEGHGF